MFLLFFVFSNLVIGQIIGDQSYSDLNSNTRFDAITSDNEHIYIIGTSIDTLLPYYRIAVFYKINIEDNRIVDNIRLSSSLLDIDAKSNNLQIIADSLHYIAIGYEFRDTIVNGQANFSYYQKFSYSLITGEWNLKSIPAFDDQGRQFVTYADSYYHEDRVYLIGERIDTQSRKKDLLVSCLHLNGNAIWTKVIIDDLPRGESQILVDSNNDLIIGSALIFTPINDSLETIVNLNVLKLNIENGELLNSFVGKQLTGPPRAIIEDINNQSYIIASDNVTPIGRGRIVLRPRIFKLSNDFKEVIWETNLSDISFAYPWHIDEFIKTEDNTYVGVGRAGQINESDILLPARIIKISADGEIIWEKFVSRNNGDFRSNWLSDVTAHKDGFVACGVVFGPIDTMIAPIQQGWVVAFDADGNLDIRSSSLDLNIGPETFDMYPNPAKEYINIRCSEQTTQEFIVSIYSLDGKLQKNKIISACHSEERIDLKKLQTGIYIVKLLTDKGSISNKLFIHD